MPLYEQKFTNSLPLSSPRVPYGLLLFPWDHVDLGPWTSALWDFGTMGQWDHGTLGPWDFGAMLLLNKQTLEPWNFGATELSGGKSYA